MERIALRTRLIPGREEAYEALHARVPEALAHDLLAAGVQDWRI
ncbi:L-rhamnose mutarotase [Microbacterium sp. CIAB417]|nr:L-rhamnose mutarotase [Microbacterium sp. CIAB417]